MTGNKAVVSKILTFSCVDGPGNRLVIFLQGCNFDCKSCHNPHTIGQCDDCGDCVAQCPTQALSIYEQEQDDQSLGGQSLQTQKHVTQIRWDAPLCSHCDHCLAVCPQQSNPKTRQYSVAEMLTAIRKNSLFITGITVTGGEATLQLKFIIALFEAIKSITSQY